MKVGIVLSGGGSRGIAHLGIIKGLEELGVKISVISGSSSGAILGALFGCGYTPDEILQIILDIKFFKILRPAMSKTGLLKMDGTEAIYSKHIPADDFAELKVPLIVNATDIQSGKIVYFSEGQLIRALMASSCIPVIFEPVLFKGRLYVDGGLLNNLPAQILIGKCDKILGCHTNPIDENFAVTNVKAMIERTFLLSINANAYPQRRYCDLFIEPPLLKTYKVFATGKLDEIFRIGYDYIMSIKDQLKPFCNTY